MGKEKAENDFLVVSELPQVPFRVAQGDDGKNYDLITLPEAMKEILEHLRALRKSLG